MTRMSGSIGDNWRERLVALVERQSALYATLDALSQHQTTLVEAGDAQGVLGVLHSRQMLLGELAGIAEEQRPLRERWANALSTIDGATRERMAERVRSIERLAAEISERDERDREMLAAQRDGIASALSSVGATRRAVSAYGVSPEPGARFQDREG
jgi:C4-dicarboxylate-specific signal transduction histidine kinase